MLDKPQDYCGVFGIFDHPDASLFTYYGLHSLQHRGQESAGIVSSVYDEQDEQWTMKSHRDFGLVLNVFDDRSVFEKELNGASSIGHNRYTTSGGAKDPANIQPFNVHYHNGNIAIAHNGNLSNAQQLRKRLRDEGVLFQSTSDTELILHLISHSDEETQMEQILDALSQIEGAYSLTMLTDDALIAVRDPNGFRPLAIGKVDDRYCVASETCAFDIIDAEYVRDVDPGEVLVIDDEATENNELISYQLERKYGTDTSQCIFEFVYFSRPDSKIFGENVDKVRRNLGKQLAKEHPLDEILTNVPEDRRPIVISVPDSSNTAALGYVHENNKQGIDCKFEIGLIRNHYVGRTFISPGQKSREQKVRTKFNTVEGVIRGRSVVIVDDSVVRGTTSTYLIDMIRKSNPAEIHFLVSSPPIIGPCFYGMDFPDPNELIANRCGRDINAIADKIGVDSLRYLSADGLVQAVKEVSSKGHDFCTACFTENYPVPVNYDAAK